MISHKYQGETFRVAKGLTLSERDAACGILLEYRARAKGEKGETYFEVDRMPEGSIPAVPKPRGRPKKNSDGIPPIARRDAREPSTDPLESDARYAQGFYRVPCAACGKPIPLTGKRGRAPKYHAECRPTD